MTKTVKRRLITGVVLFVLVIVFLLVLPYIQALIQARAHFKTEDITEYMGEVPSLMEATDENIEKVKVTYVRSLPSINIQITVDPLNAGEYSEGSKRAQSLKEIVQENHNRILEGFEVFRLKASDVNPINCITVNFDTDGNPYEINFSFTFYLENAEWGE